tara:strand:+ start:490 stop:717 length:228 start_codon:yes stop_codon:yes gene_type:complete
MLIKRVFSMNTIFDNQTRAALLEAALLEYVERYDLTKKATLAMRHACPNPTGKKLRNIGSHCHQELAKFLQPMFS